MRFPSGRAKSARQAIRSMIDLNRRASEVMRRYPVHACSDVTGFGVLGHALEMAGGTHVTLTIESRTASSWDKPSLFRSVW